MQSLRQMTAEIFYEDLDVIPDNCMQAMPNCALLFMLAQVSGVPDTERSAAS